MVYNERSPMFASSHRNGVGNRKEPKKKRDVEGRKEKTSGKRGTCTLKTVLNRNQKMGWGEGLR